MVKKTLNIVILHFSDGTPIQIQKDLKHTFGGLKKVLVQEKLPKRNKLEMKLQKEKEGWKL